MATPDQIQNDLTLEIGADLPPDEFLAVNRAFFGYVREVAASSGAEAGSACWRVQVHPGSALISMIPTSSVLPEVARALYARVAGGAKALARGDVEGGVSEPAMKHLRVIAEIAEGSKGSPTPIQLWVEHEPVPVTPEIARAIREETRASYTDYGTVEGRLRTIQDAGSLQLLLRDEALGQTVRCYFPEEMLPEVFENFRQRVEVSGLIRYRYNGTPTSIEAARIEPLPNDDDLPSPAAVRGILRAVG